MHLLRQSTTATVLVGPVLDSTGAAVTTAVVGDFRIAKEGSTAILSGATVTHDANGYYTIALTTGNTDTVGRLAIYSNNTAQSMGTTRFTVLLPSVYDALIANATNTTGGLPTATGAITAFAGAISTFAGGAVASVTGAVGSVTGNVGGNVLGYVGSINGVTFPSNFALLGIDGTGAIVTVSTVEELAAGALSANSIIDTIGPAVWSEPAGATYVDGSFGDRILISQNNTRALAVTGAGHIAAVLHDAEPNSIPEDAFVTSAISARVIATDAIDADALADGAITSGVFAADSITATALATSAGEEIADKVWDEAIAAHLASGSTGEALNNAGGSGNPWITDLSTGYTGTQAGNILNLVKQKTDLITSGSVQTSLPVTQAGQITGPLFIGDDYLNANGRAFSWTVALPSGFVVGTSVCKFGMELAEGTGGASFNATGTVIDAGGGNVTLRFDVPRATTETLEPGFYRWSVEIASASGNEVTRVASDGRKLVEWREKQT